MRENGRRERFTSLEGMGALIVGLAMLITLAWPANARRNDGLIVFDSNRGGQRDLWVMEADGSSQTNLTNDKIEDLFPAWSPDGKRIAWTRGGRGPEGEIWVMNADGSDKQQVTFNGFSDSNPTWSPDGLKIAFRSLRGVNRDIFVINVDGTGELRLTDDPGSDFAPDWSPDGTRIAFTSSRNGHSAVYSMNADGSDVQKLTEDAQEAGLAGWSPEGDRIVYADALCATCAESDLFVMNADGSGVTQITNSTDNELARSWSRTGAQVVMDFSTVSPSGTHYSKGDIAVIGVEGGATINLTNTPGISEEHPDWSPAGRPAATEMSPDRPRAAMGDAVEVTRVLQAHVSPNPGRKLATVMYALPGSGHVRLRIFDITGRELASLVNCWQSAGTHEASFSGGPRSQLYFYRLEWEGRSASGKFALVP